jgi:acetyl esterase/lipase
MKTVKFSFIFVLVCVFTFNLHGQEKVIKIWPEGIPGSKKSESYSEVVTMKNGHAALYFKVTDPTITVFLPPAEKANGMAVVICPGGGYGVLAFDYEGADIARWFNSNGIAGIVLKYRLPSDLIMENKAIGPLQDAQEALRIVRRNAVEWKINPGKIGIMGFSAGGHLASTLSTHYADNVYQSKDSTSARPDFSLLIYPVISSDTTITHAGSMKNLMGAYPSADLVKFFSGELNINEKTPPAFLVHAADDKVVPVKNSIVYFESLVKHQVPAELHVFQKGAHGFGMAAGRGTESAWPDLCIRWLNENFK